ncbi:MAG: AhpC/TSA family protein [Cyanobacteria bacterium]|nr:AhpC/TSA family protein [Cyanobacteria bacterium CG_2015-16_32_12]NCO79574.1 AhpC/TSA family protein [Cyanobacteria bacterium CG_2015-22_32_23]NCQ03177.1 AhpC/TSA family protein [Cyanobacteria bacterium CG_2015-09_32_10]NCQ40548.1 AhpC/TSA family protein [Cyanobacteria bacterium CG_2015-04_32_10]NCS84466.1 AhpC/TSA family protein [Cyanobacteria bacterium CG_2015-02_32_10]
MNLQKQLNELSQKMQSILSDDVKKLMEKSSLDLINSSLIENSLKKGDKIPNFSLPNATGKLVNIQDLLTTSSFLIISFYRGGWCPYCSLELRALEQNLSTIKEVGATLVAISPQTPDNSLSTIEKNELSFEVLSDIGNKISHQFGLTFTVSEQLRPIYESFGINLLQSNGDESYELPIPATYIIDKNGLIIDSFVKTDYTQRLAPEEIIIKILSY